MKPRTIFETFLPHFLIYSSVMIPARVAGVEREAVLTRWRSAAPTEPDGRLIELAVAPVFIQRDGAHELLNHESMQGFDALWRGLPAVIAQNPGALIKAYIIDGSDITYDQELILLSYFGDIEYQVLPFSDHAWRPLVDQLHADPGIERLYTEHVFYRPSAELSAAQMSRLFNAKVSEDSIRRYRQKLPPRNGVSTVSSLPAEAANDDEYEPTNNGAAAQSVDTAQAPDTNPDTDPPETAGDERPTDEGDDGAGHDAESPEQSEPTEPAAPSHPEPTRGRELFRPFKRFTRGIRDE